MPRAGCLWGLLKAELVCHLHLFPLPIYPAQLVYIYEFLNLSDMPA